MCFIHRITRKLLYNDDSGEIRPEATKHLPILTSVPHRNGIAH